MQHAKSSSSLGPAEAGQALARAQLAGPDQPSCLSFMNNSYPPSLTRYGEEASKVYGDAMTAAGNAAMTYMNVSSLGVKGIVKKTAKETAKGVGKNVLEAHAPKQAELEDGEGRK